MFEYSFSDYVAVATFSLAANKHIRNLFSLRSKQCSVPVLVRNTH